VDLVSQEGAPQIHQSVYVISRYTGILQSSVDRIVTVYDIFTATNGFQRKTRSIQLLMYSLVRQGGKLCLHSEARNFRILYAKNYELFKLVKVIEQNLADTFGMHGRYSVTLKQVITHPVLGCSWLGDGKGLQSVNNMLQHSLSF